MKDMSVLYLAFHTCWRCIQEMRQEGLDGGVQIKKIFGNVIMRLFHDAVLRGSQKATQEISQKIWKKTIIVPIRQSSEDEKEQQLIPSAPPGMLMSYPVYAHFVNIYLKALNQIRQIPQVICPIRILHTTQAAFQLIITALKTCYDHQTGEHEKEIVKDLAYAFRDLVVPHIEYCLRFSFSQDATLFDKFSKELYQSMPDFMILEESAAIIDSS
jgi:hypothetical protein